MAIQQIYWIDVPMPGALAVVARPRSAAAFADLKAAGIDVLVSLLESDEAEDVGLGNAPELCRQADIEFLSLPVTDHGIPTSFEVMDRAVALLAAHIGEGRGVGAHCFAGLGRSPLLVAATLVHLGYSDSEAVELVSEARGYLVPEMASQHDWLAQFAGRRAQG